MTSEIAVQIRKLSVAYNGHTALEDIDLDIQVGRYVGILGPNGAGKSTLLKVVLGLVRPTRGQVMVFGQPPEHMRGRGRIVGYLPQRPLSSPQFPVSVSDVVLMGRYGRVGLLRKPGQRDREVAMESLARVGISHLARRPIGELSGGEQQRVFIARALCVEPRLLALDEPTVSLDACAQDDLYALVDGLKREMGLTVLMVCHDVGAVSRFVDDVICINRRIHIHQPPPIDHAGLEQTFGCSVEYLFHGRVPHRVVSAHDD
jgi:zinc transport system ATP-binding protein